MTHKTDEKLVSGYIRVSSFDQVRENESLPRQEEKVRAYCKAKGLADPVIITDEGQSGFKSNRPGFQKLVALCKQGKVKTVVVYDLSRLSRSVRTTLAFIEDLIQKQGIGFISLMQDIDTESPHGKAFLTLISVFNQLYRDEISFKTKTALMHKKSKGQLYSGKTPYGFDAAVNGQLAAAKNEVMLIAKINAMRATGLSLRKIALTLESDGFKTKSGLDKWQPRFIKKLIDRSVSNGR